MPLPNRRVEMTVAIEGSDEAVEVVAAALREFRRSGKVEADGLECTFWHFALRSWSLAPA
jgi:hypothetical protein